MLHGRSHNVDLEGNERTFTWAARMHFRTVERKLLIDEYTIIPVSILRRELVTAQPTLFS